jgi:hypothetical protein
MPRRYWTMQPRKRLIWLPCLLMAAAGSNVFSSGAWQKKSCAMRRSRSIWFDALDQPKVAEKGLSAAIRPAHLLAGVPRVAPYPSQRRPSSFPVSSTGQACCTYSSRERFQAVSYKEFWGQNGISKTQLASSPF